MTTRILQNHFGKAKLNEKFKDLIHTYQTIIQLYILKKNETANSSEQEWVLTQKTKLPCF